MTRASRVVAVAFVLFTFLGALALTYIWKHFWWLTVPSIAMEPTIAAGQWVIVDRSAYDVHPPQRGDVIVFTAPIPSITGSFIKRIVAAPGDRLAFHGGSAVGNGKLLAEPYVRERINYELAIRDHGVWVDGVRLDPEIATIPPASEWHASDAVPPGCYLVFGDNRNNSLDSHVFGFLCPGRPAPFDRTLRPAISGRLILPVR